MFYIHCLSTKNAAGVLSGGRKKESYRKRREVHNFTFRDVAGCPDWTEFFVCSGHPALHTLTQRQHKEEKQSRFYL